MTPERTAEVARQIGHRMHYIETMNPRSIELECDCGQGKRGDRGTVNKWATAHIMEAADNALYYAGWNHLTLDEYLTEFGHADIA